MPKNKLHPTLNNLPSNTKTVIVQLLNERLADGLDLALLTKQAHWNMKGPQFIGVHEMVDGFRGELDTFNDEMAERITALGGTAYGTSQNITKTSKINPYPTDIYKVEDHIHALIERYGVFANAVRKAIDESDEAGDANTADLFTGISRALDKQLWFLEAHKPV
ncbi:DNA-binding ferritin-like protein (oxidative damage protectant) (Dps) (PDB:1DPS) [Commensalibacter papalotli (ex Botero et al. 2024)]|uniref:DNA starvation/stationary phase protection protein Dps n=3 Tax=Acetobacteraceae TaxID=433 RepID=W7DRM3_9PROT|nr:MULTISPECIES: DNA starvation/stationary phase protection protein Dps [Commensalibacter]EUK17555.1 DNA starvation/stationary phase protection protein Dps [Commensalibacter papalotli (ex Servin-Garciduenas et al. 2014)]CAI3952128.1 DNA-binding ferritin-like protein (oxidative damage protectant) (Dps) (PDB:1DPS) [Commensalibacter papalotli (ex Botero et al. 2024)]CAI3952650.1 DNA-binding ferritin-like protein (oxidative damage protectant) (Dps) (PDB:1DPS) [Commensalibacter papalotli (ex Botero e